jgi:hypothetical protein
MRVDAKNNTFVHYEGMTAADSAKSSNFCSLWINRLTVLGMITQDSTPYGLDVLDEDGDIIDEHKLTKSGFEYLRRSWKFKVIRQKYETVSEVSE